MKIKIDKTSASTPSKISDADQDTVVGVEKTADSDKVYVDLGGATPITDALTIDQTDGFEWDAAEDGLDFKLGSDKVRYDGATGKVFIGNADEFTFGGSTVDVGILAGREDVDTSVNLGSISYSNTAARASTFFGGRTRGTKASPSAVQVDDAVFDYAAVGYDGTGMSLLGILSAQVDGIVSTNSTPGRWVVKVSDGSGVNAQIEALRIDSNLSTIASGRMQGKKGVDVASSSSITLGTDGNYFDITGTTTIDYIIKTNWQAGSVVTLQFDSSVTVKHNTLPLTSDTVPFMLSGSVDFSATADDTLTVVYDGSKWRETARTVI